MDLDVDEPTAVRRGKRGRTGTAAGLAMLAFALGQDDPIVAVGGQPDDLEPAVGIRGEQEGAVGQPAGGDIDTALAGHDAGCPGGDVDQGDLRGFLDIRAASGHDRDSRAVRCPLERIDIETGLGQDRRSWRLGFGRRPAAARHRGIDQPDLRPAATAR
jgi:hypothetical protein